MGVQFSRQLPEHVYATDQPDDAQLVIRRESRDDDEVVLVRMPSAAVKPMRWKEIAAMISDFAVGDFTLGPDAIRKEMFTSLTEEIRVVITAYLQYKPSGVRDYLGFAIIRDVVRTDVDLEKLGLPLDEPRSYAELENLVVRRDARGTPLRVGSRLLAYYEALLFPGTTARIMVLNRPNTRAFYERRGYKLVRKTPLPAVPDKAWARLIRTGKKPPNRQITTFVEKRIPERAVVDLREEEDDGEDSLLDEPGDMQPVDPRLGTREMPIVIEDSDDDDVEIIGAMRRAHVARVQALAARLGFTLPV